MVSLRWWSLPRTKNIVRSICLLVGLSFILPYAAFAFEPTAYPQPANELSIQGQIIRIPAEYAGIQDQVSGSQKLVILIQDLHCNFEVQSHIAALLQSLARQKLAGLVGVEGASGTLNVTPLSTYPRQEVKVRAGKYLMRQGLLSGAEFFAATSGQPIALFGADDPGLYNQSFGLAREVLGIGVQAALYDLKNMLSSLDGAIYRPELARLEQWSRASSANEISLAQWAGFLLNQSRKHGLDTSRFTSLEIYASWFGRFYPWRLAPEEARIECGFLELQLRGRLYQTQQERALDAWKGRVALLEKLLTLSATGEEAAGFMADPKAFRAEPILDFYQANSGQQDIPEGIRLLNPALQQARQFYLLANARSQVLVSKLLARLAGSQARSGVLVAGGFHTASILAALKARHISSLVLTPVQSQVDEANPYLTLLSGQAAAMEKIWLKSGRALALPSALPTNSDQVLSEVEQSRLPARKQKFLNSTRVVLEAMDAVSHLGNGVDSLPALEAANDNDTELYPYAATGSLNWSADEANVAGTTCILPIRNSESAVVIQSVSDPMSVAEVAATSQACDDMPFQVSMVSQGTLSGMRTELLQSGDRMRTGPATTAVIETVSEQPVLRIPTELALGVVDAPQINENYDRALPGRRTTGFFASLTNYPAFSSAAVLALVLGPLSGILLPACSGSSNPGPDVALTSVGGKKTSQTGGSSAAGISGTGGASGVGGRMGSGGSQALGGTQNFGGSSADAAGGAIETGGSEAIGGSSALATGGSEAIGGSSALATGGSEAIGGSSALAAGGSSALAAGGSSALATGGSSALATGGSSALATGGSSALATGGSSALATGGSSTLATGGSSTLATGGSSTLATGGSSALATGGSSALATGGSSTLATGGSSALATGGSSALATGGTTGATITIANAGRLRVSKLGNGNYVITITDASGSSLVYGTGSNGTPLPASGTKTLCTVNGETVVLSADGTVFWSEVSGTTTTTEVLNPNGVVVVQTTVAGSTPTYVLEFLNSAGNIYCTAPLTYASQKWWAQLGSPVFDTPEVSYALDMSDNATYQFSFNYPGLIGIGQFQMVVDANGKITSVSLVRTQAAMLVVFVGAVISALLATLNRLAKRISIPLLRSTVRATTVVFFFLSILAIVVAFVCCSGSQDSGTNTNPTTSISTGGGANTGATAALAGVTATGGRTQNTTSSTGGKVNSGGSNQIDTSSTGGKDNSGGGNQIDSSSTGGKDNSGGSNQIDTSLTGGKDNSGGSNQVNSSSTGGKVNTGGSSVTGGSVNSGGSIQTGGTDAQAGAGTAGTTGTDAGTPTPMISLDNVKVTKAANGNYVILITNGSTLVYASPAEGDALPSTGQRILRSANGETVALCSSGEIIWTEVIGSTTTTEVLNPKGLVVVQTKAGTAAPTYALKILASNGTVECEASIVCNTVNNVMHWYAEFGAPVFSQAELSVAVDLDDNTTYQLAYSFPDSIGTGKFEFVVDAKGKIASTQFARAQGAWVWVLLGFGSRVLKLSWLQRLGLLLKMLNRMWLHLAPYLPYQLIHRLAMQGNAAGYWRQALGRLGSASPLFLAELARGDGAVFTAYLRCAQNTEGEAADRAFAAALVQALASVAATAPRAEYEQALAMASSLVRNLRALRGSGVVAEWETPGHGHAAGQAIYAFVPDETSRSAWTVLLLGMPGTPARIVDSARTRQKQRLQRNSFSAA